ncbi:MAG TPA: acyl-CoA dehydrogenase family protein [Acidimicrobiales bacterium]|nr:acyl-CoA dehydrogenase family protein [Acidimicrobiales bacterium]
MNPALPDDAVEFGDTARKAFDALGGVDAARKAEEDHAFRSEVAGTLDALGIGDIDPRADLDTFCAAAALCEAAGRVALPYPVVGALVARDGVPFAVVPDDHSRVDHGDVFGAWNVATVSGANWARQIPRATTSRAQFGRLGPFVVDLERSGEAAPVTHESGIDVRYWLTLNAWQILGTADRAVELASDHVSNRIQFGKPIATFQAVQFMLADAAVAVAGLRELAHFTLWRVATAPEEAGPDVLALRVHAIDVARAVLRTCQQLHGAAGVCDEYDISVLTRHIQPALRLPCGAERTAALLADAIAAQGFAGLFPHGTAR